MVVICNLKFLRRRRSGTLKSANRPVGTGLSLFKVGKFLFGGLCLFHDTQKETSFNVFVVAGNGDGLFLLGVVKNDVASGLSFGNKAELLQDLNNFFGFKGSHKADINGTLI